MNGSVDEKLQYWVAMDEEISYYAPPSQALIEKKLATFNCLFAAP